MIYLFALTFVAGVFVGFLLGWDDDDGGIYVEPSSVRKAMERQERDSVPEPPEQPSARRWSI